MAGKLVLCQSDDAMAGLPVDALYIQSNAMATAYSKPCSTWYHGVCTVCVSSLYRSKVFEGMQPHSGCLGKLVESSGMHYT